MLAFLVIMGSGCLKEEKPITLGVRNPNSSYKQFNCSSDDNLVNFFNMGGDLVYTASNSQWHIALDSRKEGNSARTNLTVSTYKLYRTNSDNFHDDLSSQMIDDNLAMDSVNNLRTSNAITCSHNVAGKVYIYHHEPDINGDNELKIKFQVLNVSDQAYYIQYKNLMDTCSTFYILRIKKDPRYVFNYLSFDNGGKLVKIEPPKEDWDIMFTQYRDMVKYELDQTYHPYQVLGVLLNPHNTKAYEVTANKGFVDINSDDCKLATWTKESNLIGYDWKSYSINNAIYTTDTSRVWLLRNQHEFFKLRFINYYNPNGQSGYPTLEYAKF